MKTTTLMDEAEQAIAKKERERRVVALTRLIPQREELKKGLTNVNKAIKIISDSTKPIPEEYRYI